MVQQIQTQELKIPHAKIGEEEDKSANANESTQELDCKAKKQQSKLVNFCKSGGPQEIKNNHDVGYVTVEQDYQKVDKLPEEPSKNSFPDDNKKTLSAIDEAVRETSSLRYTELGLQEKISIHLRRINKFIQKMHQKVNLQSGSRRQALLQNTDEK